MAIEIYRSSRSTGIVTRRDVRDIQAIRGETLKSVARVQGMSYVTFAALNEAGMLTARESELIGRAPFAETRFRALVDSFAFEAAQEVRELRWRV